MKAKLKLQSITEAKEGQKVIHFNKPYDNREGKLIVTEIDRIHPNHLLDWNTPEGMNYSCSISELKQIVGEYQQKVPKTAGFWEEYETVSLPVAIDDWQYILDNELIGKEVEVFEINATVNGYVYKGSPIDAAKHSSVHLKIVSKEKKEYIGRQEKPVYTEEEARGIAGIAYWQGSVDSQIACQAKFLEFWNNNKKK